MKKWIGISIAAKKEWEATCEYFGSTLETRQRYPYGGYFITNFKGENVYAQNVAPVMKKIFDQYLEKFI